MKKFRGFIRDGLERPFRHHSDEELRLLAHRAREAGLGDTTGAWLMDKEIQFRQPPSHEADDRNAVVGFVIWRDGRRMASGTYSAVSVDTARKELREVYATSSLQDVEIVSVEYA